MRRSSGTAEKNVRPGTPVLMVMLIICGIALVLKPSIKWVKRQLPHGEEAAQRYSLEEQNRRNWCEHVFESDSISQSDQSYCKDIWKD